MFHRINFKKPPTSVKLRPTRKNEHSDDEGDAAGDGDVDDDNDDGDAIDNKGGDNDIGGGDTNDDDAGDEDKCNEVSDTNDDCGCDDGNNGVDDGDGGVDEVDGSNKDVGLDNVNAGDSKNKIDLGDIYGSGDDTNNGGRVGDDSHGEINVGADGHKNDDGGYQHSIKTCFENKHIYSQNFSLPNSNSQRQNL